MNDWRNIEDQFKEKPGMFRSWWCALIFLAISAAITAAAVEFFKWVIGK